MHTNTDTWLNKSQPPEHDQEPSAEASPLPGGEGQGQTGTIDEVDSGPHASEQALIPLPDLAIEQSKPRGIALTASVVTAKTAHLPEKQRSLLRYLHHVAREQQWDWKRIASETKVSDNYIYRIWTDKYRYPMTASKNPGERIPISAEMFAKLNRWRALHEARIPLMAAGGFLETTTWTHMNWLFGRCYIRKCIGFAFGDGQIGKTTCAEERVRRHNHGITKLFITPPGGTASMFLQSLAHALHARTQGSWQTLLNNCCAAVDDSNQIIVDEASRIFTLFRERYRFQILEALRHIHDTRKCSIVFIPTNVFRDEMHKDEFQQFFKQFTRRDHYEKQLPAVAPREDLDLFAAQYGLAPAKGKAEEYMWAIARKDGLGKYIIRLQDAVEIAANKGVKVTWQHFEQAYTISLKNIGFDPLNPNKK
jgi:hypothetical protein